ncbi:MAG TPA: type IX secretion system membrane protein PorP/SprF [Ohtaekwangia sp.]|uniref:PorP/SprF family type IX secretion system membrane protein n=1 Tax=Ohtaekwangia sp. TaxID=2066019 RepID=UPI002F949842
MKSIVIKICLIFISSVAFAQDPQFSQYYQAPLYLNPGFAGITPRQRLVVNHRLQWPSLPQAFSTYAASYDIFINSIRSGIGVLVTSDKMGSANWRSTSISILYSYKVKLNDQLVFSPGLSFGYGTNGIDRSKLRMGDDLEYNGTSLDPALDQIGRPNYADFGSGFLLYSKKLWLGASFMHMNRPNISVVGEESRLAMKTAIHAGMKLELSQGPRSGKQVYLTPSFIYRMQGASFSQLDLGVNFHVDPVSVGVWYRGKPFSKNVANALEQDALILFTGLYLKNLTVGYSYDFTISKLETSSGGAHELSLTYELPARNDKNRRKYKLIPCPAFYSKSEFW